MQYVSVNLGSFSPQDIPSTLLSQVRQDLLSSFSFRTPSTPSSNLQFTFNGTSQINVAITFTAEWNPFLSLAPTLSPSLIDGIYNVQLMARLARGTTFQGQITSTFFSNQDILDYFSQINFLHLGHTLLSLPSPFYTRQGTIFSPLSSLSFLFSTLSFLFSPLYYFSLSFVCRIFLMKWIIKKGVEWVTYQGEGIGRIELEKLVLSEQSGSIFVELYTTCISTSFQYHSKVIFRFYINNPRSKHPSIQ